jgi:hypothetical protein
VGLISHSAGAWQVCPHRSSHLGSEERQTPKGSVRELQQYNARGAVTSCSSLKCAKEHLHMKTSGVINHPSRTQRTRKDRIP